jgi:hypothetical protein
MEKLPKEVYSFAKAMELKDLEPEACDIWRMLRELKGKDPSQYSTFTQSTINDNKDLMNG